MKSLSVALGTLLLFVLFSLTAEENSSGGAFRLGKSLPKGFVDLKETVPGIEVSVRYATRNNFVGDRVDGYQRPRIILTAEAAEALKRVHQDLESKGYGLLVFDGYRPQRAVNHFVRWGRDLQDQKTKRQYYPEVPKSELFRRGYIATRSGHSRGSTVDLTLVDRGTRKEVDMGTPFDYFDHKSWTYSETVTKKQSAHRRVLRETMGKHGFRPYDREWWHFTLRNEPFPGTYFDFPIE
ncbi:MAG: M15 family metallopeptidase [Verrucomicrobiota bacterium]